MQYKREKNNIFVGRFNVYRLLCEHHRICRIKIVVF